MEGKLIELVKRHDFLYNLESPNYKNPTLKEEVWHKIGRELRLPGELCKRKWKSLRDSYKRIKHTRLPEDEGSSKRRQWKHEERMKFLDNVQCSRINLIFKTEDTFYEDETDTAVNNLNEQQEQTDQEQEQDQNFDVLYTEQEVSNEADFEIENFDLNDYVKKIDHPTTTINTTNTTTTNNNNSTKNTAQEQDLIRRKKYDKDALIQEACQEMTSLLQNARKHFTPPSSNQVFFNSIALQVEEAQLPALSQMRLQQRILEMVTLEIVNHQQNSIQQL